MDRKVKYKERACDWCGDNFLPKSKSTLTCSVICSKSRNAWYVRVKKGIYEPDRVRLTKKQYDKLYKDIEEYIYRIKSNAYYADTIDLYRLVDLYDRAYPHLENIPYSRNIEKSVVVMFLKLAKWYNKKKLK